MTGSIRGFRIASYRGYQLGLALRRAEYGGGAALMSADAAGMSKVFELSGGRV